jgi:hypothetical protein
MVTGKELLALFEDGSYADLLFSKKVTFDASNALNRIREFYGRQPDTDGGNIPGIKQIREVLFDIATDKRPIHGLAIIAPHTHTKEKRPIIYTYHPLENAYVTGFHRVKEDSYYRPVTFVFSKDGVLPYEWVHESVAIDQSELEQCSQLIQDLNGSLKDRDLPLGIAIDFHFRDSLYGEAERVQRIEDPTWPGFATIVHQTSVAGDQVTEQVSWHALSDRIDVLSKTEINQLNEFRLYRKEKVTKKHTEKK